MFTKSYVRASVALSTVMGILAFGAAAGAVSGDPADTATTMTDSLTASLSPAIVAVGVGLVTVSVAFFVVRWVLRASRNGGRG